MASFASGFFSTCCFFLTETGCPQVFLRLVHHCDLSLSTSYFLPKKGSAKECSNYCTIALISHASKVMLKILQARLQQYVNHKLDLEKAEEPEIKLPTSTGSQKKQENSRKTSPSALLITPKPLCGSQQTAENSLRDGNTRPPYLPPEKSVCRSRSDS